MVVLTFRLCNLEVGDNTQPPVVVGCCVPQLRVSREAQETAWLIPSAFEADDFQCKLAYIVQTGDL